MKMTKEEKLNLSLRKATLLSEQGRFAEARLAYEIIIKDLRLTHKKKDKKSKKEK